MVGNLHVTTRGFASIRGFHVQIAKHIQRRNITPIVIDHGTILRNRQAEIALRNKPLGIAHRFYFIETH